MIQNLKNKSKHFNDLCFSLKITLSNLYQQHHQLVIGLDLRPRTIKYAPIKISKAAVAKAAPGK